MKLVFNRDQVATALDMTPEQFDRAREKLEALGFPKPIKGLEQHWAIMHVVNWVNSSHDEAQFAA